MKTAVTHLGLLAGALAAALATGATGQVTPPAEPAPAPDPAPTSRPDPAPARSATEPRKLLREGTHLVRTKGTLHRDPESGWWEFRIAPDDPQRQIGKLTLLPCTLLDSLESLVEATPEQPAHFDLTGEVFAYRGRNYLLPTHAPQLVEYVPAPGAATSDADRSADGSAREILRELEQTVGPVRRSTRPPRPAEAGAAQKLRPPGTVMLWRRGWLVREDGGAWSFVFHADATGLGDPPMVLLPCLLLEEMERHARRAGPDPAVLISGRVERYRDRNYLLPTAYQIPRDHTPLRP